MQNTLTRGTRALGAVLVTVALVGAGTSPADARGREVRSSGHCSAHSTWKLKAKADDGRLEVELEVDSNRVGQVWSVRLADNGTRFFRGHRTTKAPSGSFSVEKRPANRAGKDRITAVAKNSRSGERCSGVVVF